MLDKNGTMAFNNRDSCNTSELSTKHDEFASLRTGYEPSLLLDPKSLKSGASSVHNKGFINYDESGSESESDYSESDTSSKKSSLGSDYKTNLEYLFE